MGIMAICSRSEGGVEVVPPRLSALLMVVSFRRSRGWRQQESPLTVEFGTISHRVPTTGSPFHAMLVWLAELAHNSSSPVHYTLT